MFTTVGKLSTVAITTDGWTSRNVEGYMTLTIHYLTQEFEYRQFLLNLTNVTERNTSENLCNFIEDGLSEWGLLADCIHFYFVTDNAANIVKAISLNEKWARIPCFAHSLQLAIKSAIKDCPNFKEISKKCKSLVGFFSRSSTAKAKFEEMQKSTNPDAIPLKLIQDVETRWNSTHDMLSRILQLRMPLGAVLSEPKMPDNLTGSEWNLVSIYVDALLPFKEATVVMSGEEYATISLYIPIVTSLVKSTRVFIAENDSPEAAQFGNSLLQSLETRFHQVHNSEVLLVSMLVDPRYKNRLLDVGAKSAAEKKLLAKCLALKDPEPEVSPEEPSNSTTDTTRPNGTFSLLLFIN